MSVCVLRLEYNGFGLRLADVAHAGSEDGGFEGGVLAVRLGKTEVLGDVAVCVCVCVCV
jgi:hypothetical protein